MPRDVGPELPGGAGLIVLLACAELAPAPARPHLEAPLDAREMPSADPEARGVAPSGGVVGTCGGTVWVELQDAKGEVLGRVQALRGAWSFEPVSRPVSVLRYGCDIDNDGIVAAPEVSVLDAGRLPERGTMLVLLPSVDGG